MKEAAVPAAKRIWLSEQQKQARENDRSLETAAERCVQSLLHASGIIAQPVRRPVRHRCTDAQKRETKAAGLARPTHICRARRHAENRRCARLLRRRIAWRGRSGSSPDSRTRIADRSRRNN